MRPNVHRLNECRVGTFFASSPIRPVGLLMQKTSRLEPSGSALTDHFFGRLHSPGDETTGADSDSRGVLRTEAARRFGCPQGELGFLLLVLVPPKKSQNDENKKRRKGISLALYGEDPSDGFVFDV